MPLYQQPLDLTKFYQLDDFTGGRYDTGVWSSGTSGTGSSVAKISALGGQIRLTAGAAAGRAAEIAHGGKHNFSLAKNGAVRFRAKLSVATNVLLNVGFIDGATYNSWALITLETAVSANWQTRTRNAGSSTAITSSIAANTNWHLFEIFTSSADVKFLIDGVLVATHTTNLPPGTLMPYIYISSTNSVSHAVNLDWIEMFGDRQ